MPNAERDQQAQQSEMPKADFITSIVLLGFSAAVILLSLDLPRLENRDINPWTVPGLVPGILGGVIGLMALRLFIRSILQGGHRLGLTPEYIGELVRRDQVQRATVTVVVCLLYGVLLVGLIPYPIATFIFMFGFILLFEYQRGVALRNQMRTVLLGALEAVIVAAAVSSLFHYIFLVRLP
jgi:putative tricarboxylic transport membrane protein